MAPKSGRCHPCQEVFSSHPWYLPLPANCHSSMSGCPICICFHTFSSEKRFILFSSLLSFTPWSVCCHFCNHVSSSSLPAMAFSPPRRIELIYHPAMMRPPGSPLPLVQKRRLICSTVGCCVVQTDLPGGQHVACDGFIQHV